MNSSRPPELIWPLKIQPRTNPKKISTSQNQNQVLKFYKKNLDICTKTNEASSSKGEDQVAKENKILQKIFIAFLHFWKRTLRFIMKTVWGHYLTQQNLVTFWSMDEKTHLPFMLKCVPIQNVTFISFAFWSPNKRQKQQKDKKHCSITSIPLTVAFMKSDHFCHREYHSSCIPVETHQNKKTKCQKFPLAPGALASFNLSFRLKLTTKRKLRR